MRADNVLPAILFHVSHVAAASCPRKVKGKQESVGIIRTLRLENFSNITMRFNIAEENG
jgi:hypothetical protein